jgi:hypothetical protein
MSPLKAIRHSLDVVCQRRWMGIGTCDLRGIVAYDLGLSLVT